MASARKPAAGPQKSAPPGDAINLTRAAYAKHIRDWLADQRNTLKENYRKRPQADRNLRQHAAIVDHAIARIAVDIGIPATMAIVAVGGYGRGFLFPASDVDIVVLLPKPADDTDSHTIEAFVSLLWDVGLEPGISVRTIDECVEEAGKDVTVDTSLLEARGIWGNELLVGELQRALDKSRSVSQFFDAKIDEQRKRHARHNDVALNLEPNIKESPGGLRDLQTVLWLAKAAKLGEDWQTLQANGLITAYEGKLIARHRKVLIDFRIRLHYLAGRREDRLVFDYQTALAKELKIDGGKNKLPSEVLMRRYYLTAKGIWQMNSILLPTLLERISQRRKDVVRRIDDEFELVNGNIAARDPSTFRRDPHAIFRAFLALQSVHEAEFFEPETLRALWRNVHLIDQKFRDDPESSRLFLKILQSEKVTFNLRRMSRYGILGRYIPAFGRIVGQMQHDLFHVYTVDEHILMVIRNLRRLVLPRFKHEFPFCHELANDFARPEVLYLGALFHDIAKGRGGDHSELGKKDARQFCRKLNLSKNDTELVAWLVEMHLQMSAVAQKQDLSDPDVISQFAQRVGDERRLTALYLLTVADIRGTSPHVWNTWKAKLLEQLFRATRRLLRGDSQPNDHWIDNKKQEALKLYRERAGENSSHMPALWSHADASYFQRFEAAEIAWHAVVLQNEIAPQSALVKVRTLDDDGAENAYAVMVMTRDQPGLFARITGYFEKLAFDIAAARVYTTKHGYALDTFQILPKSTSAARHRDVAPTIERDLARLLNDPATPLSSLSGRIARQVKHFPMEPAISLGPARLKPYYELTVSCADRPGLLSSMARVFLSYDVNLHDARITTLGQRAEDVFIVANPKLADSAFAQEFQAKLANELRPL
ncbi:MAG: [protein-PII] uridylyltransferase [Betaproteobacteria bacterium]|nr:[protein-PII] uridylyltransferase [Betaproteobacteria bacterium]